MVYTAQNIVAENVDFETYLREYEGQKVEYDEGRIIEMSPVGGTHNKMVGFLYSFMDAFLAATHAGEVRFERFTMRLEIDGKIKGPEPDILVITTPNLERLTENYLNGPADLVIEVVSPESDVRDRVEKVHLYQQAGVPEYWIIDPEYQEALFYVLGEDKQYHRQRPNEQGVYQSTVLPRFKIEVALLFRDPIPNSREAVRLADELLKEQ